MATESQPVDPQPSDPKPAEPIDTSRAHPARVYDWLLGGTDNYPADEAIGRRLPAQARDAARQNRQFMHRAAAWLAAHGTDQFLDMGATHWFPSSPEASGIYAGVARVR